MSTINTRERAIAAARRQYLEAGTVLAARRWLNALTAVTYTVECVTEHDYHDIAQCNARHEECAA